MGQNLALDMIMRGNSFKASRPGADHKEIEAFEHQDSTEMKFNASFDASKQRALKKLTTQFVDPIVSPQKTKKHKSKTPLHRILTLEETLKKYRQLQNNKLDRVIERIDLDQPILMQDKMNTVWN